MNKELYKSIYDRSRLRNRFGKTPTEENEMLYKNSEINVSIWNKSSENNFNKNANGNIVTD